MSAFPTVLIVSNYHPNETLAVQAGEALFRHFAKPHSISIVLYNRKPDKPGSVRNLRRFVEKFHPRLSLILHSDEVLEADALLFYQLRAGEKRREITELLLGFIEKYRYQKGPRVFFDISDGRGNPKETLIDIELGAQMKLDTAVCLVKNLAKYLARDGN